jgi:protein-L-isoaspartate(D-aspartate) O-methyltransferase
MTSNDAGEPAFEQARAAMLESLRRQVSDERVLAAFARVPRARFVLPEARPRAYDDSPLPIGQGQTISQPLVVAIMLELLALQGDENVLDVGTGSGYQAALLSDLCGHVVTVERIPELLAQAQARLAELGCANVEAHPAGEVLGWPDKAPYDAIVAAAAAPAVPRALVGQLAVGGRLVLPVGDRRHQDLVLVTKGAMGVTVEDKGPCRFVPLVGEGGFTAAAWAN